ncbi:MAG TPA: lamin tail domain-containing protein, partial [Steroidobacteraceae bacterium]|nr:lamin tail domain-containing protein [Steroidobacteraceae bacterium]
MLINPGNGGTEYVKIFNPNASAVSLDGWSLSTLTGATGTLARATFPAGAAVAPGASVVATPSGATYRLQVDPYASAAATFEFGATPSGFGTRMSVTTTYTPALSNTAANVILRDYAGAEVDVSRYAVCSTS